MMKKRKFVKLLVKPDKVKLKLCDSQCINSIPLNYIADDCGALSGESLNDFVANKNKKTLRKIIIIIIITLFSVDFHITIYYNII